MKIIVRQKRIFMRNHLRHLPSGASRSICVSSQIQQKIWFFDFAGHAVENQHCEKQPQVLRLAPYEQDFRSYKISKLPRLRGNASSRPQRVA
jgi:hypothetical protein